MFSPWPPRKFDLIHAFNRIPIGHEPYVIGFESHLPRAFGLEDTALYRTMFASLASDRCKAIVAISECARNIFLDVARDRPGYDAVAGKLTVRYPNIEIPSMPESDLALEREPIRIIFVGNHFARKGGWVGLRMAELALKAGLPIQLDIVSTFQQGAGIWTDPTRPEYYQQFEYLKELPNVRLHSNLANAAVLELLDRSHFSLLATFGDTFGFSAIESMSRGVPVIATRQGALPEFIDDDVNGVLLDLEVNKHLEWVNTAAQDRDSEAFEAKFSAEVDRLAADALKRVAEVMGDPGKYEAMRAAARTQCIRLFSADDANTYWDALYERVA